MNPSTTNTKHVTLKKFDKIYYLKPHQFFDIEFIYNEIKISFIPNVRYSVLTRICFLKKNTVDKKRYRLLSDAYVETEWRMLGEQICIVNDSEFKNTILDYIDAIKKRMVVCIDAYDFKDHEVHGLQILIYKIHYTDVILPKKNINIQSLGANKDMINVSNITKGFKLLPPTVNYNDFGFNLQKVIENGFVSSIILNNGTKINLLELINKYSSEKHKLECFEPDVDFYQTFDYNNIITIEKKAGYNLIKIYALSGIKLSEVRDNIIDVNNFTRTLNNVKTYINSGGIQKKSITVRLCEVKPRIISGYWSKLVYSDNRIGSFDIETYVDEYGIPKTYAVGYYAKDSMNIFYIEKDFDSEKLLVKCLDSIMCSKFNGFVFYVHNLGRYDSIFLLKVIVDMCSKNPDIYQLNTLFRNEKALYIKITKIVGKFKFTVKLVDSINFLSASLKKLSIAFECDIKKGVFPYSFVKKNTIFYTGNKPNIKYYKDIDTQKNMKKEEYKLIDKKDWSTKNKTIEYLEKDLLCLFDIMDKFKLRIFSKYHTHITRNLTISGLSMDMFLRRFYKEKIPLVNKKSIYNDIKQAYYGGVTEVYKPYGKNLYYYDVNSLYPKSALNPMPGLDCTYIEDINLNIQDCLNDFFGFYYCKIITTDTYLPLLPYRIKSGLLMPNGVFNGWYFSEELKFAYENGYQIHIIKGYKFNKSYNVFDSYVNEFYQLKRNTSDPVERSIAKSLLNNLLGRFGLNIEKDITELVDDTKFNSILQTKKIKSFKDISEKKLVTYNSDVSSDICELHGVDFDEFLNHEFKYKDKSTNDNAKLSDVSIPISAAVTSYSRIHMNKIKLHILNKGGSIFYTDTDSIVTDLKLKDNLVGEELGQLKLEHEVIIGYFISNKTYCLKIPNDEDKNKKGLVIKIKGALSDSSNFSDFRKLYLGIKIPVKKISNLKNYSQGYVNIYEEKIDLSPYSYNKREKIYVNNLWVNTKPLILNDSVINNNESTKKN